jgi:hypothetical protein
MPMVTSGLVKSSTTPGNEKDSDCLTVKDVNDCGVSSSPSSPPCVFLGYVCSIHIILRILHLPMKFNQRLFVLDTQIRHLDSKSLQGFGHWLHRRWIHCQTKKNGALDSLHDLEVDEHMLHIEWKAQVDHQMKPAPHMCVTKCAKSPQLNVM